MPETIDTLFASFRQRHAEGGRPSVREWLGRADRLGAGARPELARRIDAFLAVEPLSAAEPPPEALAEVERIIAAAGIPASTPPPLIDVRVAKGLRRQDVVSALMKALSLKPDVAARVTTYYHELEAGLLDPARVSRRVWGALAEVLGVDGAGLRSLSPPLQSPPAFGASAYLRSDVSNMDFAAGAMPAARTDVDVRPAPLGAPAAADEVDRLFTGGP